jgi:hypothetical protein
MQNEQRDKTPKISEEETQKRQLFFLYPGTVPPFQRVMRWIALFLYPASVWFLYYARFHHGNTVKYTATALLAGWALVPPLWFLFEYGSMKRRANDLPNIEAFRYLQDVAAKFWLAGLGVLVAIASADGSKIGW